MESKNRRTKLIISIVLFCALSLCLIIQLLYFNRAQKQNIECEQTEDIKNAKFDFQIEEMADMKYVNLYCKNNKIATVHLKKEIPVGFEVKSSNNTIIAFSDIDNDNAFDMIFVFDSNYNVIEYYDIKTDDRGKKEAINNINDISNTIDTLIKD